MPPDQITTLVTEQAKKPFKKPNLKIVFIIIGLVILSLAGFMLYKNQSLPKTNLNSQTSTSSKSVSLRPFSPPQTKSTVRQLMDQDIKLVFDAEKYPTLISYANQAFAENESIKRYQDYVLTFQEMSKAYQQTKDPKFRQVMFELRNFLLVNPNYQKSDFVIPT